MLKAPRQKTEAFQQKNEAAILELSFVFHL